MSEKPESDEFEDEDADEPVVGDADVDLDQVNKDLDMAKRRGQKVGDPAWRRLERLLEDKRTAELTSDFEDYDIGVMTTRRQHSKRLPAAGVRQPPAVTRCVRMDVVTRAACRSGGVQPSGDQ